VEVHAVNGKWEMTRLGGANRIRAMDKHRRNVMKARGIAASAFFEVRIPALRLTFLGHREGKALKLTPQRADRMKRSPSQVAGTVWLYSCAVAERPLLRRHRSRPDRRDRPLLDRRDDRDAISRDRPS
jgi:hypothetical protein